MNRLRIAALAGLVAMTLGGPTVSLAQTAALPPALQAAFDSGNGQALQSAIASLSAGDPAKSAALAQEIIVAAEKLLKIDPQRAVNIATTAVNVINSASVQQSAPQQSQSVITIAARIFISPEAASLVRSVLVQAESSGTLSQINAVTGANINTILAGTNPETGQPLSSGTAQTTPNAENKLQSASPT